MMVRRAVVIGVFVGVLIFSLGRRTSDLGEGGAVDGGQTAVAKGMESSAEADQEFSLGLRRVHRKPSRVPTIEEGEVPYFLRRVDYGAREIVVGEVVNLDAAPSSDITVNVFSEDGRVIWGGGSDTVVVVEPDFEALSSRGTEKLEDAVDHQPEQGE